MLQWGSFLTSLIENQISKDHTHIQADEFSERICFQILMTLDEFFSFEIFIPFAPTQH